MMTGNRVLILLVAVVLVPLAVLTPSASPLVKVAAGLALIAAALGEVHRVAAKDGPRPIWPALVACIAVVVLVAVVAAR